MRAPTLVSDAFRPVFIGASKRDAHPLCNRGRPRRIDGPAAFFRASHEAREWTTEIDMRIGMARGLCAAGWLLAGFAANAAVAEAPRTDIDPAAKQHV